MVKSGQLRGRSGFGVTSDGQREDRRGARPKPRRGGSDATGKRLKTHARHYRNLHRGLKQKMRGAKEFVGRKACFSVVGAKEGVFDRLVLFGGIERRPGSKSEGRNPKSGHALDSPVRQRMKGANGLWTTHSASVGTVHLLALKKSQWPRGTKCVALTGKPKPDRPWSSGSAASVATRGDWASRRATVPRRETPVVQRHGYDPDVITGARVSDNRVHQRRPWNHSSASRSCLSK